MTTTITYEFNGRSIESKVKTVSASSITKLIDSAIDISDDHACKPDYVSVFERITYMSACKLISYHRKVFTSAGIPIDIRFTLSASNNTLLKAIKHFKVLGIMQAL